MFKAKLAALVVFEIFSILLALCNFDRILKYHLYCKSLLNCTRTVNISFIILSSRMCEVKVADGLETM